METTSTDNLYIPVLSIAGSDPSGGAGIQQDIKTCEDLGCYGMAAITALTAQSPSKVLSVFNTSQFLEAQLTALLDEVRPYAVKVGMVPDAESVKVIADAIKRYRLENIVVDTVIASTSGHALASESAVEAMKELLFPLATVITPNIPEAEVLTGRKIASLEEAKEAAKHIADLYGCRAVLVKGGHSAWGDDVLYVSDLKCFHCYPMYKVDTPNTHGTGCRLSTAIAGFLAKLSDSTTDLIVEVGLAKHWLLQDLRKNASMRFPKTHRLSYPRTERGGWKRAVPLLRRKRVRFFDTPNKST